MSGQLEPMVRSTLGRVSKLEASLREQGIHVGMGSPPHCVTDGEPWPCVASKECCAPQGSSGRPDE